MGIVKSRSVSRSEGISGARSAAIEKVTNRELGAGTGGSLFFKSWQRGILMGSTHGSVASSEVVVAV